MKNILKNQQTRILNLGILLVSIIALGIFVQGCNYEDEYMDDNTYQRFLDVDISKPNVFTSSQETIIEAFSRIEKHISFTGTEYVLTVESGNELNISERLFCFLSGGVSFLNQRREKAEFNSSIPRLKAGSESSYGIGYSLTTITLSDTEFLNYVNNMQSLHSLIGWIGSFIAGGTSGAIGSALLGTYSYFNGAYWGSIESEYINNASRSGATISVMTFTGGYIPGYQTYFISY